MRTLYLREVDEIKDRMKQNVKQCKTVIGSDATNKKIGPGKNTDFDKICRVCFHFFFFF